MHEVPMPRGGSAPEAASAAGEAPAVEELWTCPLCTLEQPASGEDSQCGACGTARPKAEPEPAPAAAPAPAPSGRIVPPRILTPGASPPVPLTTPPRGQVIPPKAAQAALAQILPAAQAQAQAQAQAPAWGQPLLITPPTRRVSITDISEDLLALGDEGLVEFLVDKLSEFGEIVGRPSFVYRADGSKILSAAFLGARAAQQAAAASLAEDLGFKVNEVITKAPRPPINPPPLELVKAAITPVPPLKAMVWYLDELDMPMRPEVEPSPTERECWIDPLPDDDELPEWLKAFGEVEEVVRLPDMEEGGGLTEKGYVLFKDHEAAASCVNMHAGTWSESERALSSQVSLRRTVVQSYPESIVSAFLGKKGEDISKIRREAQVWKLAVKGQDIMPDPRGEAAEGSKLGDPGTDQPVGKRLHFYAEGTADALERLRPLLEGRLREIHEEIRKKLEEMGDDWKTEQARQLAKHQQQMLKDLHRQSKGGGAVDNKKRKRERDRRGGADKEKDAGQDQKASWWQRSGGQAEGGAKADWDKSKKPGGWWGGGWGKEAANGEGAARAARTAPAWLSGSNAVPTAAASSSKRQRVAETGEEPYDPEVLSPVTAAPSSSWAPRARPTTAPYLRRY